MKKVTSIFLIFSILISISFITGCKKGPQDPFFSFRTRKQRMSGEWTINSRTDHVKSIDNDGLYSMTDFTIDGSKATEFDTYQRFNDVDSTIKWTGEVNDATYEFNKNGNMTYTLDVTIRYKWATRTDENTNITYDSTITRNHRWVKKGTWNFLAGVDGYKNKERIVLVFESVEFRSVIDTIRKVTDPNSDPPSEITTHYPSYESQVNQYANGEAAEVWEISELKFKEVILKRDIDDVYTHAETGIAGVKQSQMGNQQETLKRIKKK
jgi:hypothetical protein